MSFELYMLLASAALVLVHMIIQAGLRISETSFSHHIGARDDDVGVTGIFQGRAERALGNILETFPVFVALVLIVELGEVGNIISQWGAGFYFVFRVLYLPLYLLGTKWFRSIAWVGAGAGLLTMFAGILLG